MASLLYLNSVLASIFVCAANRSWPPRQCGSLIKLRNNIRKPTRNFDIWLIQLYKIHNNIHKRNKMHKHPWWWWWWWCGKLLIFRQCNAHFGLLGLACVERFLIAWWAQMEATQLSAFACNFRRDVRVNIHFHNVNLHFQKCSSVWLCSLSWAASV